MQVWIIPMRKGAIIALNFWLFILLLLVGCDKINPPQGTEAARVGEKVLYAEDIDKAVKEMDLDLSNEEIRRQFISSWIDRNLLLYEAERKGMGREKELQDRLREIRNEMVINRMLEETVSIEEPDQEKILDYWQEHTGEFTRSEDAVKLLIISTNDRSNAWGIRNSLDKSRLASEIVSMYEDIELDSIDWTPLSRLPKAITSHIQRLRVNDPSLPFSMKGRWFVVKLLKRSSTGDLKTLEEVADEIRARLIAEERVRKQIDFIAGLRREAKRKGIVQVHYPFENRTSNDSLLQDPNESETDISSNP